MKTTAEILDILRDFKAHYAEKYGIITLGLFGSAARGEHDETSDIDICIKLQEPYDTGHKGRFRKNIPYKSGHHLTRGYHAQFFQEKFRRRCDLYLKKK